MERPIFYDHYNRPKPVLEKGGGEDLVERGGYMPLHLKVEQLLEAGKRLIEYTSGYDFEGEIDEEYYPTTRQKGYDMADAFQDNQAVMAEIKRKAAVKASEKAAQAKMQEGLPSDKDGEPQPV